MQGGITGMDVAISIVHPDQAARWQRNDDALLDSMLLIHDDIRSSNSTYKKARGYAKEH